MQFASLVYRKDNKCICRRLHMGKLAKRCKFFTKHGSKACQDKIFQGHKTLVAIYLKSLSNVLWGLERAIVATEIDNIDLC
jgi:hypothetical protein